MTDAWHAVLHWLTPWEASWTVCIATSLGLGLYLRGTRRLSRLEGRLKGQRRGHRQGQRRGRHRAPSLARQGTFLMGCLLLYIALHTRLDYYFERQFFLHRLQHVVLHHIGPFLIALSAPGAVWMAGMPAFRLRRCMTGCLALWTKKLIDWVCRPIPACLLFTGLIYFWLASSVHFIAMLDWRWYRWMNWTVLVDGIAFWCLVLDPRPAPASRLSFRTRLLMIVAAAPPQIVLGATIFFSSTDLYPIYALCGRAFAGVDALHDQQLGGLILWIPGAMMSVLGALVVLRHAMRASQPTTVLSSGGALSG